MGWSVIRPRVPAPSFVALMLITGTTALSTDTYIAALPQVQRTLGTSSSVAQLTMTACIAGMAIGQLAAGPVSDARGRRSLILLATLTFAATSVLCALAFSGWQLIAARAVQGVACGAAAAVGRAVVTDTWAGREAAAKFGSLSAIGLIAPVIGPAIGGALLTVGTWRTIFWFLALVGLAMTAGAVAGLPETLPPPRRHPGGLVRLVSRARQLMTDRAFATPVLVQCLTTGGFFIYIGGSSFVLQQGLGISQGLYSVVFAVNAGGDDAIQRGLPAAGHAPGPGPAAAVGDRRADHRRRRLVRCDPGLPAPAAAGRGLDLPGRPDHAAWAPTCPPTPRSPRRPGAGTRAPRPRSAAASRSWSAPAPRP